MPFFDPSPIDPELDLAGDIGPGRENRLDDRTKLASAIEKKAGAAPHAELGRFGETLARRFAGRSAERSDRTLLPGFLGAIGAAQIRRGTDPDAAVLKDGPTRDALRGTGGQDNDKPFAPLPKLDRSVGPCAPNRPKDARTLQGKLASLGYAPRVTEKPLFPNGAAEQPSTPPFYPSGGRKAPDYTGGLKVLLDAVAAFQRDKRLKEDRLVNPGGPTERALDTQNEKARKARLDRLETVSREIMDNDAPEYAPVADRPAADSLAGLIVANEVQDQREAKLNEKPDNARAKNSLRKTVQQMNGAGSSEMPGTSKQENNNGDEKKLNDLSFDFSESLRFWRSLTITTLSCSRKRTTGRIGRLSSESLLSSAAIATSPVSSEKRLPPNGRKQRPGWGQSRRPAGPVSFWQVAEAEGGKGGDNNAASGGKSPCGESISEPRNFSSRFANTIRVSGNTSFANPDSRRASPETTSGCSRKRSGATKRG